MIYYQAKQFLLRDLKRSDAEDIARNINDKVFARNLATVPYPYSLHDAKTWISKSLKEKNKPESESKQFIIEIDEEVVGCVGFHGLILNHKAEIGYWLAKKHWGKGIVPEAVKFVVRYGFKELKLKRISAGVYSFNPASMKVLEKNGFMLEGIHKKDVLRDGKFYDKHVFAKIK